MEKAGKDWHLNEVIKVKIALVMGQIEITGHLIGCNENPALHPAKVAQLKSNRIVRKHHRNCREGAFYERKGLRASKMEGLRNCSRLKETRKDGKSKCYPRILDRTLLL